MLENVQGKNKINMPALLNSLYTVIRLIGLGTSVSKNVEDRFLYHSQSLIVFKKPDLEKTIGRPIKGKSDNISPSKFWHHARNDR